MAIGGFRVGRFGLASVGAARVGLTRSWIEKLAWLCLAGFSFIAAAPFPHRLLTPQEIMATLALGPHEGDCTRCHTMHGDDQPIVYSKALIGPDDNTLCDRCHTIPWAGGSFGGPLVYNGSSHGQSPAFVWPGPDPPTRTEAGAANKCMNCHEPHGWKDAGGLIPFLALAREEALCNRCHDGSPAASDIQIDLQKAFRHPVQQKSGVHTGPAESSPTDFAAAPIDRRHAECQDCHNPHMGYADRSGLPAAPGLSNVNLGVSRVRVINGAAGLPPTYTFSSGADTLSAPLAEYQLCFKCHSSWTTQPAGQTDLALALNPANPSYHPVEAIGRDPMIAPGSFTGAWRADSMVRCGSCHGSDAGTAEGPHGSNYRYILRQPYAASASRRAMSPDEICFACHRWDVYADPASSDATRLNSRFNKPGAGKGHAEHVGEEQVPCYSCHVTHGSTTLNHLLVTGRNPGIVTFTETAGGGSCMAAAACHDSETYTINYAR